MKRTSLRSLVILWAWFVTRMVAVGGEGTNWLTVFDERFTNNPTSAGLFKQVPVFVPGAEGSYAYHEGRQSYGLGGFASLVRPVRAGTHVELESVFRFLQGEKDDPASLETDLLLVLADGSAAGVQWLRTRAGDSPATVRLAVKKVGQPRERILREFPLARESLDGVWRLTYRHGLLTLKQHTNVVGSADIDQQGIPVAGVTWIQRGGQVECERMTLHGEPFPTLSTVDQETLRRAARLNEDARGLLAEKKTNDALAKMEEASALFVRVHGEQHHDSANSFANLASVIESKGDNEKAGQLWAKALAIHERTLGPAHPHSTLTRFNLGKNLFDRNEVAKAAELWTRCRDDWTAVCGPDYPLVKSLNGILTGQ